MSRQVAALAAFAVLTLSGCGSFGLPPEAAAPPTPVVGDAGEASAPPTDAPLTDAPATEAPDGGMSPSPTASAPPSPASATADPTQQGQDTIARMPGGNGSALPLLAPTSALPSGWTAMPARDTGYRMSVCDVDLEPSEPVDSAQQNWRRSETGPALEQHVRVYADDTAQRVVAALGDALPECTEYTAEDDRGGRSAFTVESFDLDGAPEGTVAWRQRVMVVVPGTSDVAEVVQDVALRRVGASVVLLNSYAVGAEPDRGALASAAAAVP